MNFEKYMFVLGFLILLLSLSHLNSVTLFYTDVINVIFLKKNQCIIMLLNSKIPKQVIKTKDYLLRVICQLQ